MLNSQTGFAAVVCAATIAAPSLHPAVAAMPDAIDLEPGVVEHKVERYYWSHRLVGSHVLNMQGQNIGRVNALVVDGRGTLTKMLVALNEQFDIDGTPVPIEPYRAQIVSAKDARVTVIRINLTRDELFRAQISQLQSRAISADRAPAKRDADAQ